MWPLSLFSLDISPHNIYIICFRVLWTYLTYMAWYIVWPRVGTHCLLNMNKATDLARLICDVSKLWDVNLLWLCLILSAGCVVGFLPRSPWRSRWIWTIVMQLFFFFFTDGYATYSSYKLPRPRCLDTVTRFCQELKSPEWTEILQFDQMYPEFVDSRLNPGFVDENLPSPMRALIAWKVYGLTLLVLTWVWYMCETKDERKARAKVVNEVRENARAIQLEGKKSQGSVEQKV